MSCMRIVKRVICYVLSTIVICECYVLEEMTPGSFYEMQLLDSKSYENIHFDIRFCRSGYLGNLRSCITEIWYNTIAWCL